MTAPRLPEVTARVVAWHNRHPLARRIDPTQVHSIGEVRLPFTSALPWAGAPGGRPAPAPVDHEGTRQQAGATPSLAEALARRSSRLAPPAATAGGIDGLEVHSLLPDADADAALLADADTALLAPVPDAHPEAAPGAPAEAAAPDNGDAPDDEGEAALVIPLLDGDEPPATAPHAAPPPDDGAAPQAEAPEAEAPPGEAPTDPDPDATAEIAAALLAAAAAAGAASPAASPVASPAAAATDGMPGAGDVYPPPHGNVPPSALARAVERRAAALGMAGGGDAAMLPPADTPPASVWQRLLDRLRLALTGRQRGMPPLRAAFSQSFIWPLRPGQVARWAQRHGRPQPVAPADWPHRSIEPDRARLAGLRQKGQAHDLPLHVLTAAIGVGDRRIRVLVGADGNVLGPRAYNRARVGSLAVLLAAGLVGMGWTLRPLHGGPDDGAAALLAAAPASAASAALAAASAAAPLPEAAASALALADAASAAEAAASAAPALMAAASAPAEVPAAASAPTALAAAQPEAEASAPPASIRPSLSDEERYAARVEAARLRGEPPPAPPATLLPGPVYAIVGPASRQRAAAAGSLAQMKSAASRLDGPLPTHGELLESQGQWRAAWWPFTSLVDAERARVLLAGKGVKAEVVEF